MNDTCLWTGLGLFLGAVVCWAFWLGLRRTDEKERKEYELYGGYHTHGYGSEKQYERYAYVLPMWLFVLGCLLALGGLIVVIVGVAV
jgi:hypothetical protein